MKKLYLFYLRLIKGGSVPNWISFTIGIQIETYRKSKQLNNK